MGGRAHVDFHQVIQRVRGLSSYSFFLKWKASPKILCLEFTTQILVSCS